MVSILGDFKKEMLAQMQTQFDSVKEDIRGEMEKHTKKVTDAMEITVKNLETKTQKTEKVTQELQEEQEVIKSDVRGLSGRQDQFELQLALLEMRQKSNVLRIRGLPEKEGETRFVDIYSQDNC